MATNPMVSRQNIDSRIGLRRENSRQSSSDCKEVNNPFHQAELREKGSAFSEPIFDPRELTLS